MDGFSIHWMQFSGAPAAMAASRTMRAASEEHFSAFGWKLKMIGFLVFMAMIDLNIVVDVGFVTGVTPAKNANRFRYQLVAFLCVLFNYANCFIILDAVVNIFG